MKRPGVLAPPDDASAEPPLAGQARAYVGMVTGMGVAALAYAQGYWSSNDPVRFIVFAVSGLAASAWKIR